LELTAKLESSAISMYENWAHGQGINSNISISTQDGNVFSENKKVISF